MPDVVAPHDWVPVERRLFGMDRRTLVPALVVALFGALTFWALPALNKAVSVTDPIEAGDVIQLGTDAMFTPVAGWNLVTGVRLGDGGAAGYPAAPQVTKNGVAFSVVTDAYAGTPDELLDQIQRNNDKLKDDQNPIAVVGTPVTLTTTTGQTGVVARFTAGQGEGLIAAFVFGGTGVEVVASGPDTVPNDTQADIVAMLESVQPTTSAAGGTS